MFILGLIKRCAIRGFSGLEYMTFRAGMKHYKEQADNQWLESYNMTAGDYVKTVMESKSIDDYKRRIEEARA